MTEAHSEEQTEYGKVIREEHQDGARWDRERPQVKEDLFPWAGFVSPLILGTKASLDSEQAEQFWCSGLGGIWGREGLALAVAAETAQHGQLSITARVQDRAQPPGLCQSSSNTHTHSHSLQIAAGYVIILWDKAAALTARKEG